MAAPGRLFYFWEPAPIRPRIVLPYQSPIGDHGKLAETGHRNEDSAPFHVHRRTVVEQELEVLYQISASISSHLELDEVLNQIIGLVHQVTRGDACFLYLLDASNQELVLQASKDPHPEDIGSIRLKLGEGITGWVAQEQQAVAIAQNASRDPRFKLFFSLPEDRYEAFLSVPVTAEDKVIGVINVQHRKPHSHGPAEVKLISIIGQQVGSAIENARLYEETRRRAQQIGSLLRVSETVSSKKYLEEMLNLVVKLCADMINASVCSIMLVDETRQELVLKAASSSNEEYRQETPAENPPKPAGSRGA